MARAFLTDKEVAQVIGVDKSTITRICNGQFGKNQRILLAKPEKFGGGRRWNIDRLSEVLGISIERIESTLK